MGSYAGLEHRRRREAEAARLGAAPEPSPGAASVLALQQGAGNRAVAGLLSDSSPRRLQRWSVAAVDAMRDDAALAMRGTWDGVALHHTISRERMSSIATDLESALADDDEAVRAAATEFWDAVQAAVPKPVKEQTAGKTAKTLHNLPLNLEAGPKDPGGNPGTGIDPVTVAGDAGRQAISPSSVALMKMDAAYRKLRLDPEGRAAGWKEMAKQMKEANKADPSGTVGLNEDIWFESGGLWYRKGERAFPGLEGGTQRFASRDGEDVEDIAGYKKSETVVADTTRTCSRVAPVKKDKGKRTPSSAAGPEVTFTVEVKEGVLHHSCERHSYRHFDFGQIKGVNNFWPVEFDYSTLEGLAGDFAGGIADHLRDVVLDSFSDFTDPDDLKDEAVTARNVKAGAHQIFFIAKLGYVEEDDGVWTYDVTLDTIAPDGKSADAYTVEELEELTPVAAE